MLPLTSVLRHQRHFLDSNSEWWFIFLICFIIERRKKVVASILGGFGRKNLKEMLVHSLAQDIPSHRGEANLRVERVLMLYNSCLLHAIFVYIENSNEAYPLLSDFYAHEILTNSWVSWPTQSIL